LYKRSGDCQEPKRAGRRLGYAAALVSWLELAWDVGVGLHTVQAVRIYLRTDGEKMRMEMARGLQACDGMAA
jgi:hypothetical protein